MTKTNHALGMGNTTFLSFKIFVLLFRPILKNGGALNFDFWLKILVFPNALLIYAIQINLSTSIKNDILKSRMKHKLR